MDTSGLDALLLAFALSSVIGLERQLRQKAAGLRTHTLVGVGAALFTLAGRYGFADAGVPADPSRIAAQVVTGIGFIGAGVIFWRRDARSGVRGLTTAATIWLVAAVGLASGAGAPVLAATATAIHLVVAFVYTPLVRWLSQHEVASVEVAYRDHRGVLREVLATTTGQGFAVTNVAVGRAEGTDVVRVVLDAEGRGDRQELAAALEHLDGVVEVRVGDESE
ncbi:MAG: membrane protein [Actinomycetota bacterium]|jgi:putative Mg2+ transporter-C (MgtC) family protein|nr:MAG: membrane protein [Actinomycetota bacterium]